LTAQAHCPPDPSGSTQLLESWVEGWNALIDGTFELFADAVRRGPAALDLERFARLAYGRRRPTWSTPHSIVFESEIARLRDFSSGHPAGLVPTLVLPPQAGHDSCIVDYAAEQSQMRTIVASGLEHALTLDWVGATAATADAGIEDYLEVIDRAVVHAGGRVNLIGDCQGGWLATIYAAAAPERVNTLTLAGAPIDFHAGEPVIHEVLRGLSPGGDLAAYEALVAAGGGILKGEYMLAGFVMIQPAAEIARQFALLRHLDDEDHVARYTEFEDWFKHTQDIPGEFYLWIVRNLFRDNALVRGTLDVRGRRIDLSTLDMPLNLLAGATDHITPPNQVFAIAEHASTPAELVRRQIAPGGHLGLFMGHDALREHWPALLAGVLEQSR
jgi:poly(3-hydroxyalkanoate) synthetase